MRWPPTVSASTRCGFANTCCLRYRAASEHSGAKPENEQFPTIIDPRTELLDPWVFLGAVAAATKRLRLATGMYIAPLRHPLITARAAATLHEVSDGRFMLGVGAGWLREEFAALDVPFDERGSRLDETIEILRMGWRGGPFEFHGTHFDLGPVQVSPRPMAIPLVLGGNTGPALRRAAVCGVRGSLQVSVVRRFDRAPPTSLAIRRARHLRGSALLRACRSLRMRITSRATRLLASTMPVSVRINSAHPAQTSKSRWRSPPTVSGSSAPRSKNSS